MDNFVHFLLLSRTILLFSHTKNRMMYSLYLEEHSAFLGNNNFCFIKDRRSVIKAKQLYGK